jgi:uncharacterized protein DUF1592/uncharacterized protein DUF1588/uncharacterized protein DUF1595/uncharacterized protein DUF1585/uncharacterized protein DUF1587
VPLLVEKRAYRRQNQDVQRVVGLALAVALGNFASACTANLGEDGVPTDAPAVADPPQMAPPPNALPAASSCKSNSPGPRALRRLSAAEYSATLRDLFADPNVPLTSVFSDPMLLGFSVDARALVIQGLGAQQLMDQAETVAHWAVTSQLDRLTSCTTMDAGCRQAFIKQLGKRMHRAPLSEADVAVYERLFSAEATFIDAAEAVTGAMLQSPYFLYRRELGTLGSDGYQLSPYELASSLSYLLIGSMPDDELTAAADSGALTQPVELEKQAERLLQSPRGHQAVGAFMKGWLGLSKLDTVVKDDETFQLTDSLRKAMGDETRQLIEDIIFNQKGSFSALLTAKSSFVNRELATHYGLPNAASLGDQLTQVTFEPAWRDGGLLSQGSLLTALATASESSPVQRGKMVRVKLLCETLPPPPANLDTTLKPAAPATTTREHFAAHSQNAVCNGCHTKMDPIGFGFEHYDAFGRRRELDNGQPVDATGTVVAGVGGQDAAFDGLPGLTQYLTQQAADSVNACVVRYWSYFAFGSAGWNEDQCTYDAIAEQAKRDGFALQSVVKAIVKTARFSRRVADP